jgi:hypothetical protein
MSHHRLYHYTDERGAQAIGASKMLRQSVDTTYDAAFGTGVYSTKMSPWHYSKNEIARNNWNLSSKQAKLKVAEGNIEFTKFQSESLLSLSDS